jgi:hypothetical protein
VPVESGTVTPDVKKGISTDIPPGLLRDGAPCDDGNLCTVSDTITNGVCNGAAIYCSDGSDLTTDSCDLATGQCVFIPVAKYVLPTTLGVFTPNPTQLKPSGTPKIPLKDGLPCDDGNLCTYNDMWQGGVCTGMPVVCNDGDDSTSDVCNAGTGQCMFIPLKIVGSL